VLRYILHRLLMTVPTALLVALAVFVLLRLVPGDPAQLMLGDTATEETLAELRAQLGLDQPIPMQFLYWLGTSSSAISDGRSPTTCRCCR